MSESNGSASGGADWFARITAILGLVVALAAVILPYCQSEADRKENLTIVAKPEGRGGVIRVSREESQSRTVQMPWIVTLSNTGRTKLSVVSYRIAQLTGTGGAMFFPGLDGGALDRENKPISFPLTIDAGESVSFRLHLGFVPNEEIAKELKSMIAAGAPLDPVLTLLSLAEKGVTIYGGKASMHKEAGIIVTIDPSSQQQVPIYKLTFQTGRNQEFSTVASDYPRPIES